MSELWDRLVADLRFLDIAREESKRTIYCEPHRVDQIRAVVDQHGGAGIFTVRANPICDPGQLIIVDDGAIEAAEQEFLQGLVRVPWRFGSGARPTTSASGYTPCSAACW
jgi:hypothetical protein